MVYYEPAKVIIDAPELVEVILDMIVWHHDFPNSIVSDRGSMFTSKFWLSLYYFLDIKRRLSTTFHLQTKGQTKRQNSTIEAYFLAFINFEQNNWARLLPIAEFAYNNTKNASTGQSYHSWISYKDEVNPCSKSKSADKLSAELKELMIIF